MEALAGWITAHPLESFIYYVLFMLAVQTLPRPTSQNSPFYIWLYRFAHLLATNVKLFAQPLKGADQIELDENRKAAEKASAAQQ